MIAIKKRVWVAHSLVHMAKLHMLIVTYKAVGLAKYGQEYAK